MIAEQLHQIMPLAGSRVEQFCDLLNQAMQTYGINTAAQQSAFLAQIAHESGELRYTEEIASGSAYEGRSDLGNTEPGDGVKYKGRGLIQLTGKANYSLFTLEANHDFLEFPQDLSLPGWAALSAAWYWWEHKLNDLADSGDFETITRKINGGLNGYAQRCVYWERAKKALGV